MMTGLLVKPFSSLLKSLILFLALLPIACPACAETLNLFYTVEKDGVRYDTAPAAIRKNTARRMFLELNEYGDVVIKHDDVTLVLAYNTPDDFQGLRDRMRALQPRECAAVNGFSFKMSVPF
jgi:hypothetical protein